MRAFRDLFLKPRKTRLQTVPQGFTSLNVRSFVDHRGLIPTDASQSLKHVGEKLFRAAVPRNQARAFGARPVDTSRDRMRVWIVLDQPLMDAQVWELLAVPGHGGRFLGFDRTKPIIRTLSTRPSPRGLPPIEAPLGVLGVIANPADPRLATLKIEEEKAHLEQLLAPNIKLGLVKLKWIEGPGTAAKIQRALSRDWHVLHFIGHGDFDASRDEGVLYLEDGAGGATAVPASVLGAMLAGRSVRLMVLNSCRGAVVGQGGLFTSAAAQLALHVPAVVAMQLSISNTAGGVFAERFYESLLGGSPVEVAVAEGRLALALMPSHPAIEWPAPVLYLATKEDVLKLETLKATPRKDAGRRKVRKKPSASAGTRKTATSTRKAPADDPQKHQWGGLASRAGRTMSAAVKKIDEDWFRIKLEVRTDRGAPKLTGPVKFHLHDTFAEPVQTVTAKNGVARLTLYAYGAFTVGASADRGRTRLELDLAEVRGAPKAFRES